MLEREIATILEELAQPPVSTDNIRQAAMEIVQFEIKLAEVIAIEYNNIMYIRLTLRPSIWRVCKQITVFTRIGSRTPNSSRPRIVAALRACSKK